MKIAYRRLIEREYKQRVDILDFLNKKEITEVKSVWFLENYNYILFEVNISSIKNLSDKIINLFNLDLKLPLKMNKFGKIKRVEGDYFLIFDKYEGNQIIEYMIKDILLNSNKKEKRSRL